MLVLDGGHPVGIVTRSDRPGVPGAVLMATWTTAEHGLRNAGHPCRPGARPGRPAPSSRRSTRPPPTRRPVSGVHRGYEYSRSANPTRTALERCLGALEGATHGSAFSSGLAAEDAVLRLLDPGDHVVVGDNVYGGTHRLLAQVHARAGSTSAPAAMEDIAAVAAALRPSDPDALGRDAIEPAAAHRRHRGAGRARPCPRAPCWWWTTPSPRRTSSSRCARRRHRRALHHQVPGRPQ